MTRRYGLARFPNPPHTVYPYKTLTTFLCNQKVSVDSGFRAKRNSTVAAKFTGDECWYRATVCEQAKPSDPIGLVTVHYGDFGNGETVPATRTRAIDPSLSFSTLAPLAKLCALAHVKGPAVETEYARDAAGRLGDLAGGKPTPSRVEKKFGAPGKPWEPDAQPEWLVTLGVYPGEGEDATEDGELNEEDDSKVRPCAFPKSGDAVLPLTLVTVRTDYSDCSDRLR
jgi:hypothetical protein